MSGLDTLLGASVDAVKKSGALEDTALMATVSAVNSDGTVDVTRAGDSYPAVRLLSGYAPVVGDLVHILKGRGGWVCLGRLAAANPNAWTTLGSYGAGWSNYGAAYPTCAYRVSSEGFVRLRGLARHAGATSPSTVLTLPAAIRPADKSRFVTQVSGTTWAALDVNTSGTVTIQDFAGSATYACLDVVTYYLT